MPRRNENLFDLRTIERLFLQTRSINIAKGNECLSGFWVFGDITLTSSLRQLGPAPLRSEDARGCRDLHDVCGSGGLAGVESRLLRDDLGGCLAVGGGGRLLLLILLLLLFVL